MRNIRAWLAGFAYLSLAAAADGQSTTAATLAYSLAWEDTGNHDSVLEPGESALLRVTTTMTPGVNTVIPFTGGQGGPTGTLRGIASGFFDLQGQGGTQGTFNLDPSLGYGVDHTWDLVGPGGSGTPNGTGLINIQFGQFPPGSMEVITTNPIVNVWSTLWTPTSYTGRTVHFGTADSSFRNGYSWAIIRWGPLNGNIQAVISLSSFSTVNIPIVPAPSGLVLMGLGGALACARARRRA
jgi:hypothetical protein